MFSTHTYRSILKAILFKKTPYYIQFYINGVCDLMCRHCNIVETNSSIEQMGLNEIRQAAINLKSVGVGIVLLTGGEPFLRKDLPEIVKIFTEQGMNVRLQTAGLKAATYEMLQACYDAGARDINVSLDSLEFKTSDYVNAVYGSGHRVIETIERISSIFYEKSAILSLGTVLSAFNYREIPAILEFAKSIGWYVSLVPVHVTKMSEPRGFQSYDNDFSFNNRSICELNMVKERLVEMKRAGYPLFDSETFLNSAISFLEGNIPYWRNKGLCDSPDLYFAVRPNGDFSTCCDYSFDDVPKVYDGNFVEMYKSGFLKRRKDIYHAIRNCSGCHYGSYPEVTLSVRNRKALLERVRLVLTSGKGRLSHASIRFNFIEEIEKIKRKYNDIYPTNQWMSPDLVTKIDDWSCSSKRRDMIRFDQEKRLKEGRIRYKKELS